MPFENQKNISSLKLWLKQIRIWPSHFLFILFNVLCMIPFALSLLAIFPYLVQTINSAATDISWQKLCGEYLSQQISPIFQETMFKNGIPLSFQKNYFSYIILSLAFVYGFFSFYTDYLLRHLGERIAKKTRSDIALKYFSLNYLGAKSVDAGLLSSLVGEDIREIQQTFTRLMSSILKDGLMSFIFLIWLVVLDWQLFILFITVLVPASIVLRVTSKTLKILSKQGIQFESELLSGLLERMRGWQTIQVNKAIPFEIKNFNKINDKIYHVWRRVTRAKSLGNPLVEWFGITAAAFIIIAALRRISNGSLDSSIFTSFMVTVAILSDKINRISNQLYSTRKGTEALKRIREFLIADFKRIDKTIRKKNLTQCKFETLEFQNLSIGNLTSKILAKNLNLTLRKGALLVIVGPSGVGKSTFIKTVLGLQPQISGSIFINKEIATESLFQKVSHDICFIPQEPFLFSGTIFENVVYPEKLNHPTPEEIKLAKRALSLSQLDKDLKSEIHGISGGEKQRLMFARIFYKNPGLIVIDEGTSALDLSNELKIIENLKNHVTQSITLVIAHRPAIKKYATHILDLSTKE